MHSLRTRITFLIVCVIVISLTVVTALSVLFIRGNERREADQLLLLLCETGEQNLNYYFSGIQKAVGKVSAFAEADLDGLDSGRFSSHVERVKAFFDETANKTNGVLTYYYRIDPEVSDTVRGFWFTDLDGEGFVEHEVTDISLYNTQDTGQLVWFTVPKHTGKPVWLPPYITDNLDVRVISYNVPIYWRGQYVGVVGIELDYAAMAEVISSIRLHTNGYAFLCDTEGNIFYHPRLDVAVLDEETAPELPEGLISESTFLRYTFEGEEKQAVWLPLSNGMRLVVSVPVSEAEGNWQKLVREIIIASAAVLLVMSLFALFDSSRITRPLEELTRAAELADRGNYDFPLTYNGDDEVGRLTNTFRRLTDHMKQHISDLNQRVYVDALTSVKNQGAFTASLDALQKQADAGEQPVFAVGVFDCDNLKDINDTYGHDKGNIYLKTACRTICDVFCHSPVFRIGGDEFAVILKDSDLDQCEELVRQFEDAAAETCTAGKNRWEQVHVAMGIAPYEPQHDRSVSDTVRRADKIMYANKRARKQAHS